MSRRATPQKWDESDFEFQVETVVIDDPTKRMIVVNSRVLDVPVRHKSIPIGDHRTKSVAICIHRKLTTHPCATCEYEAPRFT